VKIDSNGKFFRGLYIIDHKVVHKGGYNLLKIWFDFSAID